MSADNDHAKPFTFPRRYPRVESTSQIHYKLLNEDEQTGTGITRSLSEGGVLFETDLRLGKGKELQVTFELFGVEISASGEIIYINRKTADLYHVAVRFDTINEEDQVLIQKKASTIYPHFEPQ
ncbi:PilZ domain-containing protein [candidate division CSSED10-310 bacterium]|uniref:PilZ domain-containing protein n=1 Tax=candidate division CSSED10-310 bacterium TaxID=2855610 RepID=A0ABV6Z040_UNCC1